VIGLTAQAVGDAADPSPAATGFGSTEAVLLTVIAVLISFSAFLALAETALTRISRARAAALVEDGRRGAARLAELVAHPERFLNPVLLVVLVCQTVQAALTGVLADRLFGGWGIAVATFINVVAVFVFAEAAPKTWAVLNPDRAALVSAPPVAALVAFPPVRLLSRGLIGLTNVILPGKGLKEGPFVSEEELLALADVAVEEDVIEESERELIEQIIEFGDTVVREVMVPRPDMVAVPSEFRVGDVMEIAILNGFSRLPAYGDGVDDVVGVVYAKDLMRAERDGQADVAVVDILRPAEYVPETKKVAELLREMQADRYHMAIVVDEYGGTAGLVTLEDLIEELVGEIRDEYDREEPMVELLAGSDVRVNARMPVDEVNDLLHADLPEGDWDSVGGLVLHLLGHVPTDGEEVECDGWSLIAERVQGRRIRGVRIRPVGPAGEPAEAPVGGDGADASEAAGP
jgi:CBS domain containing-hemolysin-like protein